MLTVPELVSLSHLLRNVQVLSVYIDGSAGDFAAKHVWHSELFQSVRVLRHQLADASPTELARFDRSIVLLEAQVARFPGAVGAPGWAAFITADGVRDAAVLPVPVPTTAFWRTGMSIVPYMRALKQTRPVVIVVVDASTAEIYTYRAGALTPCETISAQVTMEAPLHMGDAARPGFHGGVRGSTGREVAQRARLVGTERMLSDVSRRAADLAGAEGWVLTGGISKVSIQAAHAIGQFTPGRVLQLESLDVHASGAEIAAAARRGASMLQDEADAHAIAEIIGHDAPDGLGALGPDATRHSLEQLRVRTLYLTPRYEDEHAAAAEDAVRGALDQGASVEHLSPAAAARLDTHGGIAARFRYHAVDAVVTATPEATTMPAAAVAALNDSFATHSG